MKVLITGGGSGGHVSPALAVARLLDQQSVEVLFVGGTLTMEGAQGPSVEQTMVEAAGFPFVAISSGKLKRDGLSLKTLTRLWGVVPGLFQAYKAVHRFKPQVVLSTGGYVSLPVVLAAWLQRIPVVIHEQTAAVGLANQLASRLATKVAITFPGSATYFNPTKVVLTGNPLNQSIIHPQTLPMDDPVGQWLSQCQKPLIYITGGGLGSHVINKTVETILPQLLDRYCLIHQTGANQHYADYERLQQYRHNLEPQLQARYLPLKHLTAQQIGQVYQQASLVIARAGANTVLELAYWGMPTIFIPIPWVTHDEQTKNATILVDAGTAVILKEADLTGQSLHQAIEQTMANQPSKHHRQQAKSLVKPQADQALVDLVLQQAKS